MLAWHNTKEDKGACNCWRWVCRGTCLHYPSGLQSPILSFYKKFECPGRLFASGLSPRVTCCLKVLLSQAASGP